MSNYIPYDYLPQLPNQLTNFQGGIIKSQDNHYITNHDKNNNNRDIHHDILANDHKDEENLTERNISDENKGYKVDNNQACGSGHCRSIHGSNGVVIGNKEDEQMNHDMINGEKNNEEEEIRKKEKKKRKIISYSFKKKKIVQDTKAQEDAIRKVRMLISNHDHSVIWRRSIERSSSINDNDESLSNIKSKEMTICTPEKKNSDRIFISKLSPICPSNNNGIIVEDSFREQTNKESLVSIITCKENAKKESICSNATLECNTNSDQNPISDIRLRRYMSKMPRIDQTDSRQSLYTRHSIQSTNSIQSTHSIKPQPPSSINKRNYSQSIDTSNNNNNRIDDGCRFYSHHNSIQETSFQNSLMDSSNCESTENSILDDNSILSQDKKSHRRLRSNRKLRLSSNQIWLNMLKNGAISLNSKILPEEVKSQIRDDSKASIFEPSSVSSLKQDGKPLFEAKPLGDSRHMLPRPLMNLNICTNSLDSSERGTSKDSIRSEMNKGNNASSITTLISKRIPRAILNKDLIEKIKAKMKRHISSASAGGSSSLNKQNIDAQSANSNENGGDQKLYLIDRHSMSIDLKNIEALNEQTQKEIMLARNYIETPLPKFNTSNPLISSSPSKISQDQHIDNTIFKLQKMKDIFLEFKTRHEQVNTKKKQQQQQQQQQAFIASNLKENCMNYSNQVPNCPKPSEDDIEPILTKPKYPVIDKSKYPNTLNEKGNILNEKANTLTEKDYEHAYNKLRVRYDVLCSKNTKTGCNMLWRVIKSRVKPCFDRLKECNKEIICKGISNNGNGVERGNCNGVEKTSCSVVGVSGGGDKGGCSRGRKDKKIFFHQKSVQQKLRQKRTLGKADAEEEVEIQEEIQEEGEEVEEVEEEEVEVEEVEVVEAEVNQKGEEKRKRERPYEKTEKMKWPTSQKVREEMNFNHKITNINFYDMNSLV